MAQFPCHSVFVSPSCCTLQIVFYKKKPFKKIQSEREPARDASCTHTQRMRVPFPVGLQLLRVRHSGPFQHSRIFTRTRTSHSNWRECFLDSIIRDSNPSRRPKHPRCKSMKPLSSVHITFLGTASAQPSSTRNHSALALRLSGDVWLFDCGEATQHQIQKSEVKMGKIEKIFITHTHGTPSVPKVDLTGIFILSFPLQVTISSVSSLSWHIA